MKVSITLFGRETSLSIFESIEKPSENSREDDWVRWKANNAATGGDFGFSWETVKKTSIEEHERRWEPGS